MRKLWSKARKDQALLNTETDNAMRCAKQESRPNELGLLSSISRPLLCNDNSFS
jgi:hypothetical protein